MTTEDKTIGELTIDEFRDLVLSQDEREVLRKRIAEYQAKLDEVNATTQYSTELFAKLKVKTVSSPFVLRSAEEAEKFLAGVKSSFAGGVTEIILVVAT